MEVVQRCKPIKEAAKGPIDELNKIRKELREAQRQKQDIYTKLGLPKNKKEYEEMKNKQKEKEKIESPEINQINVQIDSLVKERKELMDAKWKLNQEYNQQWADYESEQNLIDYINRAQDKIKKLKEQEAYEKKKKKREEKKEKKSFVYFRSDNDDALFSLWFR